MKKIIIALILIITSVSHVSALEKDKSDDEFITGKVEFISQSGREGIVILNSPGRAYLFNKGVLLLVKRGNEQMVLKITDVEGKYIRCSINSEAVNSLIKYGEDVYYSDSLNSSIKYSDARKILAEMIKLYETFILKIESTEDPRVISSAVKNFSENLDKLIPEIKRINGKYPELVTSRPEELQGESSMLEVLQPRLKEAFYKIKIYSTDENVKKATEDLQKVLIKMNTGR